MSSMKRKLHVIEEKMEHGRASLRLRTFVMAVSIIRDFCENHR